MERCQFDRGQNRAAEYKCALKNMISLELLVWWGPLPLSCHVLWKKGFLHSTCSKSIQMFLNKIPNHQAATILWINSSSPSVSLLFCSYSHLGYGANVGNVGNWGSWKSCKTNSIGLNWIRWRKKKKHSGCPKQLKARDDFKCPYSLLTVPVEQRSC